MSRVYNLSGDKWCYLYITLSIGAYFTSLYISSPEGFASSTSCITILMGSASQLPRLEVSRRPGPSPEDRDLAGNGSEPDFAYGVLGGVGSAREGTGFDDDDENGFDPVVADDPVSPLQRVSKVPISSPFSMHRNPRDKNEYRQSL
jgi:hypothetical protein